MAAMDVPPSLRRWFIAHFVVDVIFAVPLMLMPQAFLGTLGWKTIDPTSARLVAAALLGIGTQSLLGRNASVEVFLAMLNLKIIWSAAAVMGLAVSIAQGAPDAAWAFMSLFIAFSGVWMHHRIRLHQMAAATD